MYDHHSVQIAEETASSSKPIRVLYRDESAL